MLADRHPHVSQVAQREHPGRAIGRPGNHFHLEISFLRYSTPMRCVFEPCNFAAIWRAEQLRKPPSALAILANVRKDFSVK
jgi:hypothetical protein